ncbi:MAG: Eco57I restriction-modification methylase domain-containing protein [Phaeodactylibacter sp.]|nr:Eco57I restriction-modification methylase domain-containing protein [Phaeodactylibacter sp.]
MKLRPIPVKRALNKAYRKEKVLRAEIETFKTNLQVLLERINTEESEENAKNHLRDFLNHTWYKDAHLIATKGRADMVIHTGNKAGSSVGVLFEVKRPRGANDPQAAEMISPEKPGAKALHELILYYFRERSEHQNTDLKHLVITDIYRWFVFDAADFDRLFYQNRRLRKDFEAWRDGRKTQATTEFFYQEIARPFVDGLEEELPCTTFDLRSFEKPLLHTGPQDDDKLIPLFKALSPTHLLRLPFANDSNNLNKDFYRELLHIIGLEETKEKNKKVIQRKPEGQRDHGSLLENAITTLQAEGRLGKAPRLNSYGDDKAEQLFNVALELVITWINRILFLKLLEAQLLKYHRGDAAYRFLNSRTIADFDELNELFFEVLAKQPAERPDYVQQKFAHIPYLNSSLFEISELEDATLRINSLKDRFTLPLMSGGVLRDTRGKRRGGEEKALDYLFTFLEAYDFSSEGSEAIQEENKTLINASVLGLIFEKINGYQDGSFFTPGFITMYMCRETLRRAVVQKFSESPRFAEFEGDSFDGLANYLSRKYDPESLQEANRLVDSIKVCDPAVGSGHFLVSSLNELIAIKSELGILLSREGKPLPVRVEVENDELMAAWRHNDELFEYRPGVRDSQLVQEALFHEKQTLIENCLFGVDINPNSVKICRLRLWIELLKNAYYKAEIRSRKAEGGSGKTESGMDSGPEIKNQKSEIENESSSPACYADAPELQEEYKVPFSHFPISTSGLETLPNIDINIKQGNSLVSRFELKGTYKHFTDRERKRLKELTRTYKEKVAFYKDIPGAKGVIRQEIEQLKKEFSSFSSFKDKDYRELKEKEAQLMQSVIIFDKKDMEQREQLAQEVAALQARVEEKQKAFYEDAFEWRFEFPEVLDEDGNYTGFDVVIGNPPYIRQEEISYLKPYLKQYYTTYTGTADILVFFIERGMSLLKKDGHFSYIISNKFMRANFGKPLRKWLLKRRLLEAIDFGDLPVFEEATTYPCILSLQKAKPTGEFSAANVPELVQEGFTEYIHAIEFTSLQSALSEDGWTLTDARTQQLLEKLKRTGMPLGEYVEGKMFMGIKTGYNEAFIINEEIRQSLIDSDVKSGEIIKPFLAGRDIKRYMLPEQTKFLILIPNGWTRKNFGKLDEDEAFSKLQVTYPAVAEYLLPFSKKAKKRYDKGEYWWELRPCDYYDEFERPKIIYQEIATYQAFTFDNDSFYCNNKIFIIPGIEKWLLGFLNSKLAWFYLSNTVSKLRGGAFALQTMYVSTIPVYKSIIGNQNITFLAEKIIEVKNFPSAPTAPLEAEIDLLVYKLYGLSWEEVKIVDPEFGMSESAYAEAIG